MGHIYFVHVYEDNVHLLDDMAITTAQKLRLDDGQVDVVKPAEISK